MRLVAALLVFLAVAACGNGGPSRATQGDDERSGSGGDDTPTTPIAFETVAKGAQGPTAAGRHVARSEAEFAGTWRDAGGGEPPSLAGVDFATQMVLAAFQGQHPTAGYQIEITAVDASYQVVVEATEPAEGCITAQVLTAPFHVVAVPRSDTAPTFIEVARVNPC